MTDPTSNEGTFFVSLCTGAFVASIYYGLSAASHLHGVLTLFREVIWPVSILLAIIGFFPTFLLLMPITIDLERRDYSPSKRSIILGVGGACLAAGLAALINTSFAGTAAVYGGVTGVMTGVIRHLSSLMNNHETGA